MNSETTKNQNTENGNSELTDKSDLSNVKNSETVEDALEMVEKANKSNEKEIGTNSKTEKKRTETSENSETKDLKPDEEWFNSRLTKAKLVGRKLKSEPVNGRRDRIIKMRHSLQNRIFNKLGFFNSVRAREKMWGVNKTAYKTRTSVEITG